MPDWQFVDLIEPTRLESFYRQWMNEGVQLIGGCCGLTVEHIDAAQRVRLSSSK
jgi:methionine synthase I (cobalamin-dependent)